ncbi:MAG: hypothetical protein HZA12_03460 [Nitrospirae bacterium]|nr:hypothetical protein [Nitrospirota bacterium]
MKSYFVPLNLAILSAGVFFIAQITTFNIAKRLEPPFTAGYSGGAAEAGKKEAKSLDAYKPILERNIFNSKTLQALLAPPPVSPGGVKEDKPPVPVRLVGTVAGSPPYAYAVIEDPFQKSHKIFRVNDTIAPGVKLLEISRNRITIDRDGRREDVELAAQDTPGQQRTPSPPRPVSPPLPDVSQQSPGTVVLDRESVEAATEDMNRLLTQARLVPNFTGGVADGFRIFSIVPSSMFDKIGMRNGDIIYSINGMEMKDPEKAFQVYQMLKDNDRFVIDLMRAGQKMSLNYEIR